MTQELPTDDQPLARDATPAADEQRMPDFEFPFSPGQFARKAGQPHYKAAPCNHDRRPGPAPRGTRRSMGKR